MAELNRRLQLLLTEEQLQFYRQLSEERGQPVSELIRRAMEETYRPATQIRSVAALRRIAATNYGFDATDPARLLEEARRT